MSDDLFQPSVAEAGRDPDAPRPWHVNSQFWVAFFGGVVSLTLISWLNSVRLGMPDRDRTKLAVSGVLAFAAATAVAVGLLLSPEVDVAPRTLRIVFRGVAVVLYFYHAAVQRPADRRHAYLSDDEYASLWGPGLLAVVVGSVIQLVLVGAALLLSGAVGEPS